MSPNGHPVRVSPPPSYAPNREPKCCSELIVTRWGEENQVEHKPWLLNRGEEQAVSVTRGRPYRREGGEPPSPPTRVQGGLRGQIKVALPVPSKAPFKDLSRAFKRPLKGLQKAFKRPFLQCLSWILADLIKSRFDTKTKDCDWETNGSPRNVHSTIPLASL